MAQSVMSMAMTLTTSCALTTSSPMVYNTSRDDINTGVLSVLSRHVYTSMRKRKCSDIDSVAVLCRAMLWGLLWQPWACPTRLCMLTSWRRAMLGWGLAWREEGTQKALTLPLMPCPQLSQVGTELCRYRVSDHVWSSLSTQESLKAA